MNELDTYYDLQKDSENQQELLAQDSGKFKKHPING